MFRKKRRTRWMAYDDIRNGHDTHETVLNRLLFETLYNADKIHKKMMTLRCEELSHPEIFEDKNFDEIYNVSNSIATSFAIDMSGVFLLDLLDCAAYGTEAYNMRFSKNIKITDVLKYRMLTLHPLDLKTAWPHFRISSPCTNITLYAFEHLWSLVDSCVPEHKRIYSAYMSGKTSEKIYKNERDSLLGKMLVNLYKYYNLQIDLLKLVCPHTIPEYLWISGELGNKEEYMSKSHEMIERSKKIDHYREARLEYSLHYIPIEPLLMRVNTGEISLEKAYQEAEIDTACTLDSIWDFIVQAKGSRGTGYAHVWKFAPPEYKDEYLLARISSTAISCKVATSYIGKLFVYSISIYPQLNEISGSAEGLFEMLCRKGTGDHLTLASVPGTEHLFPSDFISILVEILNRYLAYYKVAYEQDPQDKEKTNYIKQQCIRDLCKVYSLDWLDIIAKYPEFAEKSGLA